MNLSTNYHYPWYTDEFVPLWERFRTPRPNHPLVTISRSLVEEYAEAYRESEPLYTVEQENVDLLPAAFERGEFGRRDAEWVVRWYYRRYLGDFPDVERRRIEEEFERNDYEAISEAISGAVEAETVEEAIDHLTALQGVGIPVASAFLMFIDPEQFVVVGEREWSVLRAHDELADPYPDPPMVTEYETYLEACREVADRVACDLWTLYQALWRLWKEQ